MAVDTLFFFNDKLYFGNTTTLVIGSTTAPGYAVEFARDPTLGNSWKPVDSSGDEYLLVDGGSTGWLGGAGEQAYWGMAYDARGTQQDYLKIYVDTADDPAFSSPSLVATSRLTSKNEVNCDYQTFNIPGTPKRYYRIQFNIADRHADTKMPKLLYTSLHKGTDVISCASYNSPQSSYDMNFISRVGRAKTGAGVIIASKYGAVGQQFSVEFDQASDALWTAIKTNLSAQDGSFRPFFIQHDGLDNVVLPGFFVARMSEESWKVRRTVQGIVRITINLETETWL